MPYAARRSRRPTRKLPLAWPLVGKEPRVWFDPASRGPQDRPLDSTSDFADTLRAGAGVLAIWLFPSAGLLYLLRQLSTFTYASAVSVSLTALLFSLCWRN